MSELGNRKAADVYRDLFHLNNNNIGLDETLRAIQSGNGEDTKIKISTTQCEVDFAEGRITKPEIKCGRYTYYSNTGVGGTNYTVDLTAGNIQKLVLTSGLTNLNLSGAPTGDSVGWVRLIIERATFTIANWPASTYWQSGSALNLGGTTSNSVSVVEFMTLDGGSAWYALILATSMAVGGGGG